VRFGLLQGEGGQKRHGDLLEVRIEEGASEADGLDLPFRCGRHKPVSARAIVTYCVFVLFCFVLSKTGSLGGQQQDTQQAAVPHATRSGRVVQGIELFRFKIPRAAEQTRMPPSDPPEISRSGCTGFQSTELIGALCPLILPIGFSP